MDEITDHQIDAQIRKEAVKVTLAGLASVLAAKAAVEAQEAAQIKLCREAGASWEKIAREYGITRQAVFQKWSKKV